VIENASNANDTNTKNLADLSINRLLFWLFYYILPYI
jgi:hypothetical protein